VGELKDGVTLGTKRSSVGVRQAEFLEDFLKALWSQCHLDPDRCPT